MTEWAVSRVNWFRSIIIEFENMFCCETFMSSRDLTVHDTVVINKEVLCIRDVMRSSLLPPHLLQQFPV